MFRPLRRHNLPNCWWEHLCVPGGKGDKYLWFLIISASQYWRLTNQGLAEDEGYPKMITVDWGLPDDIDAAFLFYEDTYFFKVTLSLICLSIYKIINFLAGRQLLEVQRYENGGKENWPKNILTLANQEGYPKPMRDGFPGIPSSVDAAFLWGGNNRIYFFKVWHLLLQPNFRLVGQRILEVWSHFKCSCAKRPLPKGKTT